MGCQNKVIYTTPEISGQMLNGKTNQPIEGASVGINNQASDITDKQGYFMVPPITYDYTVIEPRHREVISLIRSLEHSTLLINRSGYEIKSYKTGGLAFIPKSYNEKSYINMGEIYLMPVPAGQESKNHTYYPTLDFCKPSQSQKKSNCISVPQGGTYKQVSPNQPIK